MSANRFDVGDEKRVTVRFTNIDEELQDPLIVRFGFTDALGVTSETFVFGTDVEVVKDGVGIYHFDLTFTNGSDTVPWWVRFEGEGDVTAAEEESIFIRVPNVSLS